MGVRRRWAASVSSEAESYDTNKTTSLQTCKNSANEDAMMQQNNNNGEKDDDISLFDLFPAILVSTFVSVGSYYSCESIEMAEDVIIATIRTFAQLSLLAAFLSQLFRFVDNKSKAESSSTSTTDTKAVVGNIKERMQTFFSRHSAPILVLAYIVCFMLPLAAYEASARTKLTLRPPSHNNPTTISAYYHPHIVLIIVITSLFTAIFTMGSIAIIFIVKPTPWYSPRHLIPLCGMLFNNALSGTSLALDLLFTDLQSKQKETMELMIGFGADTWTATRPCFRSVLYSALKPQINSMNVIGLVAIPGMMTGQVLGGASPVRAARYQIVIMCLILGASFVAVGMAIELVIWNAFDNRGVLMDDWIVENDSLRVSQVFSSLLLLVQPLLAKEGTRNVFGGGSHDVFDGNGGLESTSMFIELRAVDQAVTQQSYVGHPFLQVNLNGSYANGKRIMNANLTIATKRDFIILQGPSGVGKTTLLKSIAELGSGFYPFQSSNDLIQHVSLYGKDRSLFHPSAWRRNVLYVPQRSASALQSTPHAFLQFIASSQPKHESRPQTLESLVHNTTLHMASWGIHSPQALLSRSWSKLSGGESQRVLLAIALATEPQVLLLDEPTSALDDDTKWKVEETLKRRVDDGCAIVMVTHDEEQAKRLGTVRLQLEAVS